MLTTRRAVDLSNLNHRLSGSCPWCGETVTVTADVFYNRFHGSCPHCNAHVAYRAPEGTFRTDVVDPSPTIWRIDHDHYCADCRYEISTCSCQPRKQLPSHYRPPQAPPWRQRIQPTLVQ